jgi:hypothetical protein
LREALLTIALPPLGDAGCENDDDGTTVVGGMVEARHMRIDSNGVDAGLEKEAAAAAAAAAAGGRGVVVGVVTPGMGGIPAAGLAMAVADVEGKDSGGCPSAAHPVLSVPNFGVETSCSKLPEKMPSTDPAVRGVSGSAS